MRSSKFRNSTAGRLLMQAAIGISSLLIWEGVGLAFGDAWTSRPSLIFLRLVSWLPNGLLDQFGTTLGEVAVGLCIGAPLGALAGFLLGRSLIVSEILRPIINVTYSIPFATLAPYLIFVFGLGASPKIFLVAIISFFLLLFNTFSGVKSIDTDLIDALQLMGASRREIFLRLIVPGSMAWIMAGVKTALPFSLVAAIAGEMLAPGAGLGSTLVNASSQFNMTAYFAALSVVMLLGLVFGEFGQRIERYLLRWRDHE